MDYSLVRSNREGRGCQEDGEFLRMLLLKSVHRRK